MKYVPLILLLLLSGCKVFDAGQAKGLDASHTQVAPPPAMPAPAPREPLAEVVELTGEVVALQHTVASQQETVQQSAQVAGVQMKQLAESVKGVEAHLSAQMDAKVEAHATMALRAVVEMENRMEAHVDQKLHAVLQAFAEFKAEAKAQASVNAAAQAGLENIVKSQHEQIEAQRDAYVTRTQMDAETRKVLISSHESENTNTKILAGVLILALLYSSRMHVAVMKGQVEQLIAVVLRMAALAENVDDDDESKRKTARVPKTEA